MRETFSACINTGSASSANVDVVMSIVLRWVRCDSEVKGEFLKKRAVVCCVLCIVTTQKVCVRVCARARVCVRVGACVCA